MKHISFQSDDVPAAPFLMDRRRTPERRAVWRGGRRDSDWEDRPIGAWNRLQDGPRTGLKGLFASLHLW